MTAEERFAFAAERFMHRDDALRRFLDAQRKLVKEHDGEDVCRFSEAPAEQWCEACQLFTWAEKKKLIAARSSAKMAMRKWWRRMHGAEPEGSNAGNEGDA